MAKILLALLSVFFPPPYEEESLVGCLITADALCCTWEYPACYDYVQDDYCFSAQAFEWEYRDVESTNYEEKWDDHREFLRYVNLEDLKAIQEYYKWNNRMVRKKEKPMIETLTYISPEGDMVEIDREDITVLPPIPYKELDTMPAWPTYSRGHIWSTTQEGWWLR
jgi:hypothetical protein